MKIFGRSSAREDKAREDETDATQTDATAEIPTEIVELAPGSRVTTYEDLRRLFFLILGFAAAALLVVSLGKIVMLFVVVFFLSAILNPIVVWFTERAVPRGVAVVLVMLGLIGILVGVGFLVVPPIIEQSSELAKNSDKYSSNIATQFQAITNRFPQLGNLLPKDVQEADDIKDVGRALSPQFEELIKSNSRNLTTFALNAVRATAGALITFLLALLLTTFVLLNPAPLISGFLCAVPSRYRGAAGRSIARIEGQMLGWIRATVINGVITGISTGLLLWWIGVEPPLVFGALAFFGEFIPNIGPFIAAVPALFVAAGMGAQTLLFTALAILFVQQVESNLLVPFIMGKQLELHPFSIIFFAIAFGALFGLAGAILAVPAAAVVKVLFDEFYLKPNGVPEPDIRERSQALVNKRRWSELEG